MRLCTLLGGKMRFRFLAAIAVAYLAGFASAGWLWAPDSAAPHNASDTDTAAPAPLAVTITPAPAKQPGSPKTLKKDENPIAELAIGATIKALPEDYLVNAVTQFSDFSAAELQQMDDVRGFANRLREVAWRGVLEPSEVEALALSDVTFSLSPAAETDYHKHLTQFESGTQRIYGNFNVLGGSGATVIAKWYRVDQPELYDFKRYQIDLTKIDNYVWYQFNSGWPDGEYALEILSADEALDTLAFGSFTVGG